MFVRIVMRIWSSMVAMARFTYLTRISLEVRFSNAKDGQGNDRANYRCAGLADMAAAIATGKPHRCSLELATHVVEIMTAILQSAESRKWVDMVTTCERPDALSPDQAHALLN
jgi:predicted dehydrogenase